MNNIINTLKQYTNSIYDAEMISLNALNAKSQAKSDLDLFMLGIDNEIAANKTLKNESMRKAAKQDLLVDNEVYQDILDNLELRDREYRLAQINLDRVKNEFTVAKIEARLLISQTTEAKQLQLF